MCCFCIIIIPICYCYFDFGYPELNCLAIILFVCLFVFLFYVNVILIRLVSIAIVSHVFVLCVIDLCIDKFRTKLTTKWPKTNQIIKNENNKLCKRIESVSFNINLCLFSASFLSI